MFMDERGTMKTGPRDHVIGPGKDEPHLMIVDTGNVERYYREDQVFRYR